MEGIYWGDLRAMIDRACKFGHTLGYKRLESPYRKGSTPAESISIFDYSAPRRSKIIPTGNAEADWELHSFICNAGYINGFIPLRDNFPIWDDKATKWEVHPIRGALSVIRVLLGQGCIERTKEIEEFLRR